jgi:hypothetical protein
VNNEPKVCQGSVLTWILLPGLVKVKEENLLCKTDPSDGHFDLDMYLQYMYCCDTRKFFQFQVTAWYNGLRTNSRVGRGSYCIESFPARFTEDHGICPHWPALSELTRLGMCTENSSFKDIRNPQIAPSHMHPAPESASDTIKQKQMNSEIDTFQ